MSFDKPTRNALAKMVGECRRLLTADIRDQLQRVYGLQPDGTDLPVESLGHLDERGKQTAVELREWHEHLASTEPGSDAKRHATAFDRLAHETAFTALNRLAALRLCEERGHVIECVRRGTESDGFKLFERLSGGALGSRARTYQAFLERMFDELAVDLGVLFDCRAPQSLVFPGERCLEEALGVLNDSGLVHLWQDDETIGWIYQYFNPKEERDAMRKASPAPRNGRELAVRNQFFTPRYVVEFLTDNTLGRTWYEMRRGDTRLTECCRYLVRMPTEIFLDPDQKPPKDQNSGEEPRQDELLRRPAYVPFRPKKDPRDLKILDPACGSGHFLLYAFDLLEVIYEEAWEDEKSPPSEASGNILREDYSDFEALRRDLPSLILRHNLHGIEIDSRCCQIAALALWLRAQRSFQKLGLKAGLRPQITRSNIVCAEPMPGELELLEEFVAGLKPPLLGQLVRTVSEKMQLAGEAGSLLRIEEEIRGAIAEARKQWVAGPAPEQMLLLPEPRRRSVEQLKLFDLSGISEEGFWLEAEARVIEKLSEYATEAVSRDSYRRRLFAEDTARGFAFIDLCRMRFDVVLMNPPFGEASKRTRAWINACYPRTKHDLLASFCERGLEMTTDGGLLGEISSRVAFFLKTFAEWRNAILGSINLGVVIDLGSGVLDGAMVESACYVLWKNDAKPKPRCLVIRLVLADDKGPSLLRALTDTRDPHRFLVRLDDYRALPHSPLIYWISTDTLIALAKHPCLEPNLAVVRQGLGTGDNNRFIRTAWEVPAEKIGAGSADYNTAQISGLPRGSKRWAYHVRSGSSQPWYSPLTLVIDWENSGARLKEFWRSKGETPSRYIPSEELYFRPGFSWTRRAFRFIPYVIPAGCIPSASRYMAFPLLGRESEIIGLCASNVATAFMRFYGEKFEYPNHLVDTVKRIPTAEFPSELVHELTEVVVEEIAKRRDFYRNYEPFVDFTVPALVRNWSEAGIAWNPRTFLGHELEVKVARAYGLEEPQLLELESDILEAAEACTSERSNDSDNSDDDGLSEVQCDTSPHGHFGDLVSYAVGCAFGRWDVRFATKEKSVPDSPDALAPLPACPPGQLQNDRGLPLTFDDVIKLSAAERWQYPLELAWDGILLDDPGHSLDIEGRVQKVLQLIWKDGWESIERDACEILRVRNLRDYFRKPAGFFADHLRRYSKSRRQAPIYWPLSTSSGSYTLWVYYHRLTDQTLFACVNDFIQPKLNNLEKNIAQLKEAKQTKDLQATAELYSELDDFKQELLALAPRWKPDLNDGVLITACPLWKFFRLPKWRKDLEECHKKLEAGDYDWAHLAYSTWPERVREKCKTDRSLAIAHRLEDVCEVPAAETSAKNHRRRGGKAIESAQINIEEMETKGSEE